MPNILQTKKHPRFILKYHRKWLRILGDVLFLVTPLMNTKGFLVLIILNAEPFQDHHPISKYGKKAYFENKR